ncbi:MAG: TraB/GumN family protein [Ruminiclostridium sp.]|nr:TraB/GumN family protein [Ruminiclostridium sp.]
MKKRLTALIIAAGLLCSCSTNTQQQTTTTTAETTTAATTEAETTTAAETTTEATTEVSIETEAAKPAVIITDHVVEGNSEGLAPAIWQVTDPESGNTLKMMGTIHIIPDGTSVVPQYAMDIYNESAGVAVEYDISKIQNDLVIQIMYLSYFMLDEGELITDHLSPETYEAAKAYLTEQGLYTEAYDAYSPSFWESLITSGMIMSIEGMKESGVDSYFIELAKADGKEVRSIEALETQMDAITFMTDELCEYNISEALSLEADEMEESFMELYDTWATGDVDALAETEEESLDEYPEDIRADYEAYNQKLLYDRNVGMADKAAEYIENGDNIFYMVGFAHMCGEDSVPDLLEEMGYTVERIY